MSLKDWIIQVKKKKKAHLWSRDTHLTYLYVINTYMGHRGPSICHASYSLHQQGFLYIYKPSILFLIEERPCAKFCCEDKREARLLFWSQASGTVTRGKSHIWKGSGQVFVPFGWANEDSLFLWGNVSPMASRAKALLVLKLCCGPALFCVQC